jgi:DnaK suppressor protein
MARRDALLRLHKTLVTRREDILKKLRDDLDDLREMKSSDPSGDPADVAFGAGSDEMASQLAEYDSRELGQIERALHRLKQGTYGVCEACHDKIPVGRLNALPYTTLCIDCQRELEKYPDWDEHRHAGNWEKVYDSASALEEPREVNLNDIEIDISSNR